MMLLCVAGPAAAQFLPLPQRSPAAPEGDAFAVSLFPLTREERESRVVREVLAGNIPVSFRALVPVTTRATIQNQEHSVTWYVLPEYLAVGSDENYFLMPLTPLAAQEIADSLHCILPTRKMVDAVYQTADVRLAPRPIPPSPAMTTVPVFKDHNDTLRVQRSVFLAAHPLGQLVGGHKKDVVISNAIVTNLKPAVPRPVVIYGWHQLNGVPIQPLYNGHSETYVDYSHGTRLVQDSVLLDGQPATVAGILTSPTLWPLLSDEGVIARPRYGETPAAVDESDNGSPDEPFPELENVFPNPFNPVTSIQFALYRTETVRLTVFDLLGREIRTLVDGVQKAGLHTVIFDGSMVSSGPLFCRLVTPHSTSSKMLLLLK